MRMLTLYILDKMEKICDTIYKDGHVTEKELAILETFSDVLWFIHPTTSNKPYKIQPRFEYEEGEIIFDFKYKNNNRLRTKIRKPFWDFKSYIKDLVCAKYQL